MIMCINIKVAPDHRDLWRNTYQSVLPGYHAHLTTSYQMELLVKNGVTTVCDVSASEELQNSYDALNVWSSRTSIWMDVDDADVFVKNTMAQGGKYIKVVADLPQIMGGGIMEKAVLEEIVRCTHENNLKVAVYNVSGYNYKDTPLSGN